MTKELVEYLKSKLVVVDELVRNLPQRYRTYWDDKTCLNKIMREAADAYNSKPIKPLNKHQLGLLEAALRTCGFFENEQILSILCHLQYGRDSEDDIVRPNDVGQFLEAADLEAKEILQKYVVVTSEIEKIVDVLRIESRQS